LYLMNGWVWQAVHPLEKIEMEKTMAFPLEALESEVLKLPKADRVRLLDRVVASLDSDARRDAAWDTVAAERDAQTELDPTSLVALDDVLVKLRAELK
jgi:Putative addiction module component